MTVLDRFHPGAVAARERFHADTIAEVASTVARDRVVLIGMGWNPFVKQARRILQAEDIGYSYLEYGNYLTSWKPRLAIKIWAGWPTFPMVFVNGALIGGASDLEALRKSGELKRLIAGQAG
ncbi:MAG: glutaredoxin [Pseudomonadota bacterium]|nr:glutaredoxin [Pseudomonadota bacterium]